MSVKNLTLNALTEHKGKFLSGADLSAKLDVSRTAIWKAINALRKEGYIINAVTNKGYMLIDNSNPVTSEALLAELPERHKDIQLHLHDTIDSTNTYAKQLALNGANHGTVVLARCQTGGKGRLGRSFYSPKDGIYLSIVIKPTFDITKAGLVTTAVAVAVTEAIESVCDLTAGIKWVNDVYVAGKKVCGILSEGINDFETGQIESIIIGIGLNTSVNDFPEELLSIAGAVEGDYSRTSLIAEIISRTLDLTGDIESRSFLDTYKKKSLVIGKNITVYKGIYKSSPDEVPHFSARVLDIDDEGGLKVIYSDGTIETLTSGEISIRL